MSCVTLGSPGPPRWGAAPDFNFQMLLTGGVRELDVMSSSFSLRRSLFVLHRATPNGPIRLGFARYESTIFPEIPNMSGEPSNPSVLKPWEMQERMRQSRGILLAEGIVFVLCGLFAIIVSPMLASTLLILFLGWVALGCGLLLFIRCFMGSTESLSMNLMNAIFITGLGILFLIWPFESLEVVTLFLAGWCLLTGIMNLAGKPARSHIAPGVQFISGIAGILLAVLLIIWWPSDALWAPGILFGVQLLFGGMAVLAVWNALGNGANVASPPQATTK